MAKKKSKTKAASPVSFEASLEQLRQIVGQLENGNLTLSDSLQQYEKGVASLKQCYDALNAAQRKIEMLVDLDEDGNMITRPFDNTASADLAEGSRRSSRAGTNSTTIDKYKDIEDEEIEDVHEELEDDDFEDMDDPNSLF